MRSFDLKNYTFPMITVAVELLLDYAMKELIEEENSKALWNNAIFVNCLFTSESANGPVCDTCTVTNLSYPFCSHNLFRIIRIGKPLKWCIKELENLNSSGLSLSLMSFG